LAGGTARKKPSRAAPARAAKKAPAHRAAPPAKRPSKPATSPTKTAKKGSPPKKPEAPKRSGAAGSAAARPAAPIRGDGRVHVLSLSFVRDGDEFLARLETDGGQITELKNRSLDQLLTLVAGELEDLLE